MLRLFARVPWGAGSRPQGGLVMFSGCLGLPLCGLLVAGVVGSGCLVGGGGDVGGEGGLGVGVGDGAAGAAVGEGGIGVSVGEVDRVS